VTRLDRADFDAFTGVFFFTAGVKSRGLASLPLASSTGGELDFIVGGGVACTATDRMTKLVVVAMALLSLAAGPFRFF
jgi:hypothetical protein